MEDPAPTTTWRYCAVPGTFCVEVVRPDISTPVCVLYVRKAVGTVDILDIYVPAAFRRKGYARAAIQYAAGLWTENNPTWIATDTATKDALPMLKALGFRKYRHGWRAKRERLDR